jgi:hypothetical protein
MVSKSMGKKKGKLESTLHPSGKHDNEDRANWRDLKRRKRIKTRKEIK